MLADNMGYGDLGSYGSGGELRGMPTPSIDKLASEGLRLSQFFKVVGAYLATLKDHPNPPAFSMTEFER